MGVWDEEVYVVDPADAQKNKLMAILAYIGPAVLAPVFAAKDSRFAQFHANQGVCAIIAELLLQLCIWIVGKVLGIMPFGIGTISAIVIGVLQGVAGLMYLVYAIVGIINANKGVAKELPGFATIKVIKY